MKDTKKLSDTQRTARGVDGIYLDDLADGTELDIETQHRHYKLEKRDNNHVRLSGHPTFCPKPVEVEIEGSIERNNVVPKRGLIGRGMYLVFRHPQLDRIVTTSRIRDVQKVG